MSTKYFNDNEQYVVQWLNNLFSSETVDGRSITDIMPEDVDHYTRAHFFAGIGGWELALNLAGWPEKDLVWTGSCPCQPFSTAGKRKGKEDERNLWPEFYRLIKECRPPVIFGEQVASKLGREWLSGVQTDLEVLGYRVAAADLCAAGIGAPHIRQRLYWVADTEQPKKWGRGLQRSQQSSGTMEEGASAQSLRCSDISRLADSAEFRRQFGRTGESLALQGECSEREGKYQESEYVWELSRGSERLCATDGVGDTDDERSQGRFFRRDGTCERFTRPTGLGAWEEFDLIECADGKIRRFEPESFPLASGVSGRVGKLRAYGNAIVPPLAAEFIRSYMEARDEE